MHLVTSASAHPGPGGAEPPAELTGYARHRWIAGCDRCRANLLRQCALAGFTPKIAFTTDDYVAVQALVAADLGVSTLPALCLRAARHPGIRTVPLPGARRYVFAVRYGDPPDPPAVNLLMEVLRAAAVPPPRTPTAGRQRGRQRGRGELQSPARTGPAATGASVNPGLPVPGDLEPIPGQLALPGMPSAAEADGGAGGPADAARPGASRAGRRTTGADADPELAAVAAELRGLDGDGSRMAAAIRGALDMLLDGQHTGRYRWDQLHKTEKTHAGTLVEIALARVLRLADGAALDYTIAGADVDCKFSHRLGGWMIPPEADGKLMLLVQASDEDGTWSAGLLRAAAENLRPAGNRDGKRALNERGRAAVCWLHARAPLQENVLIRMPDGMWRRSSRAGSGQQRVNELFRRAQRMRVSRTVVATVAMQDDYMKRVRGGGGARDQLRAEGIVIFGDYAGDQVLAAALGLPRPGPGEFVSARLVPRPRPSPAGPGDYARSIRLAGADWLLASAADPAAPAPALPR